MNNLVEMLTTAAREMKLAKEKEFAEKIIAKFGWLPTNNNTSEPLEIGKIVEYPNCFPPRAVVIGRATPEEVSEVKKFFAEQGIPIESNTNDTYKVMVD